MAGGKYAAWIERLESERKRLGYAEKPVNLAYNRTFAGCMMTAWREATYNWYNYWQKDDRCSPEEKMESIMFGKAWEIWAAVKAGDGVTEPPKVFSEDAFPEYDFADAGVKIDVKTSVGAAMAHLGKYPDVEVRVPADPTDETSEFKVFKTR